jgi:hypothetical protein
MRILGSSSNVENILGVSGEELWRNMYYDPPVGRKEWNALTGISSIISPGMGDPPGLTIEEGEKFHRLLQKAQEASDTDPRYLQGMISSWMQTEYPWARARSLGGIDDRNVINDAKKYRKYFKQAAQELVATGKYELYQMSHHWRMVNDFSRILQKAFSRPDLLTDPEIGVLLGAGFDPWGVAERAAEQEKIMQAMLPPPPAAQPPPPPPKGGASQPRGVAPASAQPGNADALLAALLGGAGGAPGFAPAPTPPPAPVASPVPGVTAGFDPRTFGRDFIKNQRLMVRGALSPVTAAAMYNRVPAAPVLPQNAMFGGLSPFL